jgi:hypothetical protein
VYDIGDKLEYLWALGYQFISEKLWWVLDISPGQISANSSVRARSRRHWAWQVSIPTTTHSHRPMPQWPSGSWHSFPTPSLHCM